jgi:predicted ATPase
MITRLAISGYRSLRKVRITLSALNVVTGANGSGKSSLYRALKLLADIAQGQIIQSLAAEGGRPCGPARKRGRRKPAPYRPRQRRAKIRSA